MIMIIDVYDCCCPMTLHVTSCDCRPVTSHVISCELAWCVM